MTRTEITELNIAVARILGYERRDEDEAWRRRGAGGRWNTSVPSFVGEPCQTERAEAYLRASGLRKVHTHATLIAGTWRYNTTGETGEDYFWFGMMPELSDMPTSEGEAICRAVVARAEQIAEAKP